jgi:uncharacterized protein YlbG (UPF0298 family)
MQIVNGVLDKALAAFVAYNNKQITLEELREKLFEAMLSTIKTIEVSHADTLAKTYQTFWTAADNDKSNLMKNMWAAALGSQIFVLFWSQFCVPLLFAFGMLPNWKAGTSAEWAYLLVGALLGMGPMVLRSGPGAGSWLERLKDFAKK